MAQAILLRGGAGGVSSDDVTAGKAQVLQGYKTVTNDSDDEVVEGTIPNRGNIVDTVSFENAHWESKFVARMEEGYYSQAGQWKPCVAIPYEVLASVAGIDAGKMLDTLTVAGVRGTVHTYGAWNNASEVVNATWENKVHVRFEEGCYSKDGNYKPTAIVPYDTLANTIGLDASKMLNSLNILGKQGQIKTVDTAESNYRINKSTAFGIDNWTDPNNVVFYVDFPHGNGYYNRSDGHPHVCIDAVNLGTAGADSVLSGQTATSVQGVKFAGAIQRWICTTGDVITALGGEGFVWDDSYAGRGRGIVMKIPNKYFIQDANYAFLASPNLYPQNIREGVNVNGVVGTMVDYSVGRPVFENATFNALYVGGVANKDFPEARIYRERTQSHNNYSKYIGGTTIDVQASSNYHLSAFSNYVGFILDRAILFTFFRQLKVTYKLNINMHTGRYNRTAGVNIFVFIYDANNRSRNIGGNQATHRSGDNIESVHNENTYELIVDTSMINQDGFVALCADAYSDDNLSSAIGNVTFTKIELIN
nr:MAG TPA: hypothetical protein [Caudoviricetes sp.]